MTDKEKLVALLNEWEVPFREETEEPNQIITVGRDFHHTWPESKKVSGYAGFYTLYEFSAEGSFLTMGAWE